MLKFDYKDTDKKIEIELYGIVFEVNIDENSIKELKEIEKNENALEETIEKILGKGAIEKINKKRIEDGHKKLDANVEFAIIGCIFEAYTTSLGDNTIDRCVNSVNRLNEKVNKFNSYKKYNNYRGYRRR